MSDQYPQYQPPDGGGSQPQGQPDDARRFDAPYGQPGPPGFTAQPGPPSGYGAQPPGPSGYGQQAPAPGSWTPDPGYHYQTPPSGPPHAGPPPGPQPWLAPGTASNVGASAKGFLAALFDFHFDTFITPKIIKAVYIVVTVIIGLTAVGFLLSAVLGGEPGLIVLALIGVPLAAIVYLAMARMTLELYFAVVRLSEDVHERLPRQ